MGAKNNIIMPGRAYEPGHAGARMLLVLVAMLSASGLVLMMARPALAITADEPLVGVSSVTPAQLEGELSSVNPGHIHGDIAQLYVIWGYRFGIRADLAFAQMLHETNFLRYGGDVGAWQNNFAGIGATGGGNRGNNFATAELGVIAHYAHLAWYVYPSHQNGWCSLDYDPRHFGPGHRYGVYNLRDLGGRWASPGIGYGDAIARYATGIWNFSPRGNWLGSFNEIPGTPASELSTSFYFPWYDCKVESSMPGNWILVANRGVGTATVEIFIGSTKMHDPNNPGNDFFTIPEAGEITPIFPQIIGGPVKIVSTSGQLLMVSQRVLYKDSFNEVMGTPEGKLSDSYDFTWYDSKPDGGMTANWILVANTGSSPADVEIWVGSNLMARYSAADGNAIAPGRIETPRFSNIRGGPVKVRSTNHQPLIASQRVLYRESFSEVMGVPTDALGSEYLFTWYDFQSPSMKGDWVLVANRGNIPADVDIYAGGILAARYSTAGGNPIPVGEMVIPQFQGLMTGPVRVVSTNGQALMSSQRVLYRDSFEEVQGIRPSTFTGDQWFTWYDSMLASFMRGDWILISNQGTGEARVEIHIAGVRMADPDNPGNEFFTIPEGSMIMPQFNNTKGGPVQVSCLTGQPLLASQRVLYKDGLSR